MSNIFVTSDTHWGHSNIILYSSRPFKDVAEMNQALIDNWNNQVKPGDEVYHLGDFAFMKLYDFKKVLSQLNGKIHVILGNHDQLIENNKRDLLNQGKIVSINHYAEITYQKQLFCFFHYGQRTWNKSFRGSIHLWGHSHGTLPPYGKSVDVGVDCKEITSEYRPINLDEVIQYMSTRPKHESVSSD